MELFDAALPERQPSRGTHERGCVESGERLAPRGLCGFAVLLSQPADEPSVIDRRRQTCTEVAGKYLLQQDGLRPAVEHDVMIREDEPVLVFSRPQKSRPERELIDQIAHRGPLGGAEL